MLYGRELKSELGYLAQPDGSVHHTEDDTSVVAFAYGPAGVRANKENEKMAVFDVVWKPKIGLSSPFTKYNESFVLDIVENAMHRQQHPRTCIYLTLQEMQDTGGLLSCAVNAACLALLDAAVPLQYQFAASSCVQYDDKEFGIEEADEKKVVAKFTHVFESRQFDIVASHSTGKFSKSDLEESVRICKESSKPVFKQYRELLERKLSK